MGNADSKEGDIKAGYRDKSIAHVELDSSEDEVLEEESEESGSEESSEDSEKQGEDEDEDEESEDSDTDYENVNHREVPPVVGSSKKPVIMRPDFVPSVGTRESRSESVFTEDVLSPEYEHHEEEEVSALQKATTEAAKILSQEEIDRLTKVYVHCNTNKVGLSQEQLATALALLGQKFPVEVIREVFTKAKVDPMPQDKFVDVVCELRMRKLAEGQAELIQNAFESLHNGICGMNKTSNKDESGRSYLDSVELRKLLTTQGDKLTDEEADQFIRECKIKDYKDFSDGSRRGLIYLDQYRDVLINSA